jgi:plastocyanin
MIKFLGVAVAGFLLGLAGMAFAHDMSKMDLAAMDGAAMAPSATQTAAMAPNAIEINNFAFGPETLTVAAGTTVTWTNHDDEPHTVVNGDNPRLFKSGALDTDDKFTFTFDKPGTYKYFCSIHPHMTGTVVVK